MKRRTAAGAGAVLLGAAFTVHGDTVIMDQIGQDPSVFVQHYGPPTETYLGDGGYPGFPLPTEEGVDDFQAPASLLTLTNVSVVMVGGSSSNGPVDAQGWEVNIYSSLAALQSSFAGDVAHVVLPASAATLTGSLNNPYNTDAYSALVSLPVQITLPAAGKYYVGVIPEMRFLPASMNYYSTSNVPGFFPAGSNAYEESTFNGLSGPGGDLPYRVTATPEPSAAALIFAAAGILGGMVRRSRRPEAALPRSARPQTIALQ